MAIKSVLLTGATGYLGGHLSEYLSNKSDIKLQCLVRPLKDGKDENSVGQGFSPAKAALKGCPTTEIIYGDLLQPDSYDKALNGIDVVIHAATFATLYNHAEEEKRYFFRYSPLIKSLP